MMWGELIRSLLREDNLLIGIGELSKMTGISTRQLRYWEQKGYISSMESADGSSRKYLLPMVIKVQIIARYLQEGYTLAAAVERTTEQMENVRRMKKIVAQTFQRSEKLSDGQYALDMGDFDEKGTQTLYLIYDEETGKTHYQVVDRGQSIDLQ